jgi:hypothetical protein
MKVRQLQTAFIYQGHRAPYEYGANAKMWTGGIPRGSIFIEFGGDTEQEAEEGEAMPLQSPAGERRGRLP